jgi:hypothetical protein
MKNIAFLILTFLLLQSCATVYHSPDSYLIAKQHKVIAIIPPSVSIPFNKKMTQEQIASQQKAESINFQNEIFSWMLKRKTQQKISVELLDIQTTNARLQASGYFDGKILSPSEMCQALGVDGVITSNFSLSKPMSEGAGIAMGLLIGYWGPTKETTVNMNIHDKETSKMIWSYNHTAQGNTFNTTDQLVNSLMRNASKNMPYIIKI